MNMTYEEAIRKSLDKFELDNGAMMRPICFAEFIIVMAKIVEHLSASIPYRETIINGRDESELAHRHVLFMSVNEFLDWLFEKQAEEGLWYMDTAVVRLFNEWVAEEDDDER